MPSLIDKVKQTDAGAKLDEIFVKIDHPNDVA